MKPILPSASAVIPYLKAIDQAGTYSNFGPLVTLLERRYATYLRVDPDTVVTASSATLGIAGAISVSSSGTWLAPAWTFPATGLAILTSGRQLAFADVEPDTWVVSASYAPGDTGLLPVAPFGAAIHLSKWSNWNEVVLDAAASLGTQPDLAGLPKGWAVVFSLHATKVLGCGEGGLVVFGDPERAREFRAWSNFGFRGKRISQIGGTNAKLSEIAAAYALAALDGWPLEKSEWGAAHTVAGRALHELGLSGGPTRLDGTNPYWVVDFGSEEACQDAEMRLARAGVETRRWWPASLPESPAFAGKVDSSLAFPVAHRLSRQVLGLPMYRRMGQNVAEAVMESLGTG